MPTSKETRVRVDWRSKIIASTLSSSRRGRSPAFRRFLRSWAKSRMARSSEWEKSLRSRKCLAVIIGCPGSDKRALLRGAGRLGFVFGEGFGKDAYGLFDVVFGGDQRRQEPQNVVAGRYGQKLVLTKALDEIAHWRGDLDA